MPGQDFKIVCEVEPATRPDLMHVRHQIGSMSRVASSFLIPDNHIGRATVSSIAVAHEVALMGGNAIACLNARDRNIVGFRRDLLTAAAYGVSQFLFVYGDRPETGKRSDDLTVRSMLAEARRFEQSVGSSAGRLSLGVSTRLGPVPSWKLDADALFVQVSFSVPALVEWREHVEFDGPVYAGVMVAPSATMARRLSADIPELAVPTELIDALDADGNAGVDFALSHGVGRARLRSVRRGAPHPRLEIPRDRGPARSGLIAWTLGHPRRVGATWHWSTSPRHRGPNGHQVHLLHRGRAMLATWRLRGVQDRPRW